MKVEKLYCLKLNNGGNKMEILKIHRDYDIKFTQFELKMINTAIEYFLELVPAGEISKGEDDTLNNLNLIIMTLLNE